MAIDLSVIDGPYLRDILDQPRALESTLANLHASKELRSLAAKLHAGAFTRIVLTGMGSSFHALHPAQIQLTEHGFTAVMIETSELVHYHKALFDPSTLIIAVSQSGQSVEMLRLIELNSGAAPLIAVSNTSESPLARKATAAVITAAGEEFSVSCKTYVAALMALRWLTRFLCGGDVREVIEELRQAGPCVRLYLEAWQRHVESLVLALAGIRHFFLVGRGYSLAAVCTGALITKESDHFPAEGMSSAAFRHGPFEMLSDETFVLVFGGDSRTRDLNLRLLDDIRRREGIAELVDAESKFPVCQLNSNLQSIQPILEILPVQMITIALAAQVGREPGRFEFATKVTTIE